MLTDAGRKAYSGSEKLAEKVEKLSHEIEDFVADELKGFFNEMKTASE